MKTTGRGMLAIIALFLVPVTALADISGVYATDGQKNAHKMTLSYRDSNHVRMETGKDQYMLVSGDKTYMVQKRNGQWTAMDMAAMGQMMKRFGMHQDSGQKQKQEAAGKSGKLIKTGRTETVAGYKGTVYEAVSPDGKKTEMVLTDNPDIRKLTEAWVAFSGHMMSSFGLADANKAMEEAMHHATGGMGGVLKVQNGMRLESVSKATHGSDYFSLPAGVKMQSMPNMGAMPPGAGGASADGDTSSSNGRGFVQGREDTAHHETRQELEQKSDENIKKGVHKLMNHIFGG